ncbi:MULTISPECIES: cadherin domain-containing protein [unclassified Moorena]|uniref:cadherin domain-containing protein n=1 Tax=unclassified Moorena TaxID=2683338 RepID=UPI0013FF3A9B|nr:MULTISPECIES: cadherin domain-containing protein [unclassified Moorena]NEO11491.1 hypothetical protein [Moorena sp. SIO3E8]NEP97951.1 hypothetical protein [Moorena sp. SIO3F7]
MSDTFFSADSLLYHHHWDTNTITYSFYKSGPYYGSQTGVSEISEGTKDNIRSILETLEIYLDVDFREVADTATDYGLLRYMVSDGPGYAYAYLPNRSNTNSGWRSDVAGDVHINEAYDTTGNNGFADDPGNHGYMTLIHEIGHTLGLKHPNPYEDHDYGPFLPFNEDNTTNTVMSYNFAGKPAITPMTYDIKALQSIYGAREYNHGDTTYSFESVYGYTDVNEDYGATKEIKQTLWDSGGVNTLDFSNLTPDKYYFDMNQGGIITTQKAYNSISYKARTDDSGTEYFTSKFGTAIAFDTVIHNLINSSSDDYIIANSAANIFSGYEFGISTGDDIIEGWNYLDTLDLSNYAFDSVIQTQSGDDLILGLGWDSSITVKDYYAVSQSDRLNITFEQESPPPVWEKIIVRDTINISKVQDIQKEPKPTNTAPTDISLSSNSVKEFSNNGTTIATLNTNDVDAGDSHTYKLLHDAKGRFKIDGNQLKVKNGNLLDFDDNSSHDLKIRTTDSGGESYDKTFTIDVLNQNIAPTDITLDRNSVKEFSNNGTTIARLSTNDVDAGDTHTYKLLDDAQGRFKIDGNQLKVKNGNLLDFDVNNTHQIKIRTTDSGGESYDKTFTIDVLNQNIAPTDITISGNSVKEFSNNGTTIAKLSTKDVDAGDTHTYKLLDDAKGRFKIDGNQLKVKNGHLLDFDDNSSHQIKIRTTDSGGESYDKTFTIDVLNQNLAPTDISLDRNSVKEFSNNGTTIARLSTKDVDPGDTHTYELLDDAQGRFKIDGNQLKVKDGSLIDFDNNSSHNIKIRTTDSGGESYDKTFSIQVQNQNNAPTDISLDRNSVNELSEKGTTIGTLSTNDVDREDNHTYELLDDAKGRFDIVGNQLQVKDGSLLDFDNNSSHDIKIRTTDSGGKSYDKTFSIQVQNQNIAPTDISLDRNSVNELSEKGTTIGTLSTNDVDREDNHTYELLDDAKGRFEIVGNKLQVKNGSLLDFDNNSSHDIKIRTTDSGGKSYDKTFSIQVQNQNNAPTDINLSSNSVKEFSNNGTTIATLTTKDVDSGDNHKYKLLHDAKGRFKIDGNQLKVKNGHLLDFDENSSHDIKIRTTDSGGKSYDKTFTIDVLNQNNAPTDITISGNSVKEFSNNGTTIATLSTKDVDAGDSHTYKLLDDAKGRFKIDGNQLKVKNGSLLDFDVNNTHQIKIRTTDSGGESYDKTFSIEVENQNNAPTDINLSSKSVKEFSKNGTTIATLTTQDVDWGDSHSYQLLNDAQGRFKIDGNQLQVKNGSLLDFDVNNTHQIKIRTTDSGGESYDKTFSINVQNQNIAPTDISITEQGGESNDTLIGGSGDDTLSGGYGDDSVVGGFGNDKIWGNRENDTLIGGSGDDTLSGGSGDDSVVGGSGNDKIWGNRENDTLIGGSGDDTLSGGSGDDSVVGGAGNDYVRGTWGNDNLDGGDHDDTLKGGQGNDFLEGGSGNDSIMGDVGNDNLKGSSGEDTLSGGSGYDTIEGGDDDDYLRGNAGDDFLKGGDGDDYLRGDQGNDSLEGGAGNDSLIAASGDDHLDGGDGNDTLKGSSGNNYLIGGSGDDSLDGGGDHDLLEGGSGKDTLIGGSGNDTLNGVGNDSRGNGEIDVLVGGGGSDTFLLGDDHGAFYQGGGDNDYAKIDDFDSQDMIQLYGVADQYDVLEADNGLPGSTALYFEGDLIAVFKDASVSDVSSRMEFLS